MNTFIRAKLRRNPGDLEFTIDIKATLTDLEERGIVKWDAEPMVEKGSGFQNSTEYKQRLGTTVAGEQQTLENIYLEVQLTHHKGLDYARDIFDREALRKSTLSANTWMKRLTIILSVTAILTLIVQVKQCDVSNRQSQVQPRGQDSIRNKKTTSSIETFGESGDWFSVHNDKDEYGYADRNGTMKIPFGKYSICYTDTFKTFAIVIHRTNGFVGIDKTERILFQVFPFDNGPDEASEGLFRIVEGDSIGFANMQGQIVIKPKFTSVSIFSGQLAAYCKDCNKTKDGEHWSWTGGKWGFINKKGDTAIDPIYEAILIPFDQGKAKVRFKGQEFWIDEKGKKI